MNRRGVPTHSETRVRKLGDSQRAQGEMRSLIAAKPAVERRNRLSAPLSIGALILGPHPQHIEKLGFYFEHRAARAHAPKSLATFACRSGVDRIQHSASGKWGEVPVFDISRIEMTMFNDVTPSALKRKFAAAPQVRQLRSASVSSDLTAVFAAEVVRQFDSFPAEANPALVRSAAL